MKIFRVIFFLPIIFISYIVVSVATGKYRLDLGGPVWAIAYIGIFVVVLLLILLAIFMMKKTDNDDFSYPFIRPFPWQHPNDKFIIPKERKPAYKELNLGNRGKDNYKYN